MKRKITERICWLLIFVLILSGFGETFLAAELENDAVYEVVSEEMPEGVAALENGDLSLEEESKAQLNNGEVRTFGTDSLGKMLEAKIEGIVNKQASSACTVFSAEVSENIVHVDFQTLFDGELIVGIYTEDGKKLLTSGKKKVIAGDEEAEIEIERDIPEYFYLRVFVVDEELKPLSLAYDCPNYTREMQDFLKKTTDDFDVDRVINLDEKENTNFLVFSNDVVSVCENNGTSKLISVDEDKKIYAIETDDERITDLKKGDTLSFQKSDRSFLIVKVDSITVEGKMVTISGADTDIESVFSYVKIESSSSSEDINLDTSKLPEGITCTGVETEQRSDGEGDVDGIDGNARLEAKTWHYDIDSDKFLDKDYDDNGLPLHIEGTMSGSMDLTTYGEIKYYLSAGMPSYIELKIGCKFGINAKLKIEGGAEIPFGSITMSPCAGVYITFTPSLVLEGTIELEMSLTSDQSVGFRYTTGGSVENISKAPEPVMQIKGSVTLFLGVKGDISVSIISEKISKIELNFAVGPEIKAVLVEHYDMYVEKDINHYCEICVDGTLAPRIDIGGEASLLGGFTDDLKVEIKLTIKPIVKTWYYSLDYDEFGWGKCPHRRNGLSNPVALPDRDTHREDRYQIEKQTIYSTVYFGRYWQNDTNGDGIADTNDAKEPIRWKVLSVSSDDLFLLSEVSLDVKPYNESIYTEGKDEYGENEYKIITWEKSTIRSWLNGYGASSNDDGIDYSTKGFINQAFNAEEIADIKSTYLENSDNIKFGTEGGNNTTDKIFLLSIDEVLNPSFRLRGTDNYNIASDYAFQNNTIEHAWLRSPGCGTYIPENTLHFPLNYNAGYDARTAMKITPAIHLSRSSSHYKMGENIIVQSFFNDDYILEYENDNASDGDKISSSDIIENVSGEVQAVFSGLKEQEVYNYYVIKDECVDDILSEYNLLYISQGISDEDGNLTFTYYPREEDENALTFVVGMSTEENNSDSPEDKNDSSSSSVGTEDKDSSSSSSAGSDDKDSSSSSAGSEDKDSSSSSIGSEDKDSSSSSGAGSDDKGSSSSSSAGSDDKDSSSSSSAGADDKDSSSSSSTSGKDSSSSSSKDGSSSSAADVSENRVLPVSGAEFASSKDNFAPVVSSGRINSLVLDFSNVKKSGVSPDKLTMTVVKGTKFNTAEQVKEFGVSDKKAVKVKINKKTGLAQVTPKSNGWTELTMQDGSKYKITFTVETPKANKSILKLSVGGADKTFTIKELFGTDVDGGTLSIVKEKPAGQAKLDEKAKTLTVSPKAPGKITLQYAYLNKKYKATINVK